jgi:hypothetical protein
MNIKRVTSLRGALTTKQPHGIVIVLLLLVLAAGCTSTKATTKTAEPQNAVLKAAKTAAVINVDGITDEDAWGTAAKTTVKLFGEAGVEAKDITIRALYDKDNVYITASYADKTPFKIGEAWKYDGKVWSKDSYDDSLSLVWDMNNSIKDFDHLGMGVMTTPLKNGMDIFDFKIADPTGAKRAYEADYWGW